MGVSAMTAKNAFGGATTPNGRRHGKQPVPEQMGLLP